MTLGIPVSSSERHAQELVDLLVDHGPLSSADCRARLGWSKGRFDLAVKVARESICPALGLAIPSVTPHTGWLYEVTTEWQPVEAGASWSLGLVESRLAGIHRDVHTIKPHLEVGSREWRRANFLDKHLGHIIRTLEEINHGKGQEGGIGGEPSA